MDSLTGRLENKACDSCQLRFIDLNAQTENNRRNVFDWMKEHDNTGSAKQNDQTIYGK